MAVRPRGGNWQADLMVAGQRYRHSFDTKEAAEDWEESARKAARRGLAIPAPGEDTVRRLGEARLTMRQALDLARRATWGVKGNKSIEKSLLNAQAAVDFFGADRALESVTALDLTDYVTHLRKGARNSGATINRKLSALRVVFKTAARNSFIATIPAWPERQREGGNRMRRPRIRGRGPAHDPPYGRHPARPGEVGPAARPAVHAPQEHHRHAALREAAGQRHLRPHRRDGEEGSMRRGGPARS